MKQVIYKSIFGLCSTTEDNYNAKIQDANKIQKWEGFESVEEIIDYATKYLKQSKEDFIIA